MKKRNIASCILMLLMILFAAFVLFPILIVFINSFKGRLFISSEPFTIPKGDAFVGMTNYTEGLAKTGWITVASVLIRRLFTSMIAWYITRVKGVITQIIYYALVFSMIVPFQMVMFTMSKIANMLSLDNPVGIIVLYVGFGAGMASFMFSGFIKSIPLALEEAAMIDGASPVTTFFQVVLPMLRSTAVTIAILNTMWIWNDYLMPYLTIGTNYRTIPVAIQYLRGGYGAVDMGAMMAMLVLAMVPVIVFYLVCQKHIIKGVLAGAVKG